jgi:hydrogenase maturation protease
VNILVAGIGNIFQGDDAFGCEVARVLSTRTLPAGVRVVDFGIRGLDLTYALLDRPDLAIFVDAMPRGGEPGTIYTIEPDLENLGTANQMPDPHGMDPVRVLGMAKTMGGQLGRILLVGCEPGDLGGEDGRMGLTEPVSAAIGEAAGIVESLIAKQFEEVVI